MGMLTRFRSRLHSIHNQTNLHPSLQAEKTANTVCLLSMVALLPYLTMWHYVLLNTFGVMYSCFVLPAVITANYFYPVNFKIPPKIRSYWTTVVTKIKWFLQKIYAPLDRVEKEFMNLKNIAAMLNQVVFFALCDTILIPGQTVTCLYTLMFYNVIAYCVAYIKELIEKEDWSPYVQMTEHSNMKHLAMSATKIVLEWTKAVTFIITVVFMLLVFGLEQGLEHYKPTSIYMVITWLYYAATEKVFVNLLLKFLTYLQLPILESLEPLWMPVVLHVFTAILAFLFSIPNCIYGRFRLSLLGIYINVYLCMKDMYLSSLKDLNCERAVLSQYRYATEDELKSFDDVCAVCLSDLSKAKITPCHHLYHSECLRQCLKKSNQCPICKRELKFD